MNEFLRAILPELILIAVACVLFLLGVSSKVAARRLAPLISLAALGVVFAWQIWAVTDPSNQKWSDPWSTICVSDFANYIKLLTAGIGLLLVLLAWPTNADATGSPSLNFAGDAGEFFALMLLSISGVFLVAGANDIILLFLGIELASIPTYIMVSISRPLPVAQEAGVKYFFLGAMAAAVMLFGFSYLYGTTGLMRLDEIASVFTAQAGQASALSSWQLLAILMLLAGFAFKIAAVPLHVYAGDVYQGAATPVTAFLAFVPKTSGFVAIIKLLAVVGGTTAGGTAAWAAPQQIVTLLWVVAALTMTFGNVLGLLQQNVKRVLAYSSIAHSGYMLVGLTALVSTADREVQRQALQGVLFYLAAYGVMNAGAFGVLMLLPSRGTSEGGSTYGRPAPATTAETFEDLAGTGRRHVGLGLAMAVCCFSLIGLPLTIGFFGKFVLLKPALNAGLIGLVIVTVINAAISAAYYLHIVATMFLRTEPEPGREVAPSTQGAEAATTTAAPASAAVRPWPVLLAIILSVVGTLAYGTIPSATNSLTNRAVQASVVRETSLPNNVERATAPAASPSPSPDAAQASR